MARIDQGAWISTRKVPGRHLAIKAAGTLAAPTESAKTMTTFPWRSLRTFFIVCCVIATICTASWQISTFIENNEVTEVNYRHFHVEEKDVYPSVTLCFVRPFNNSQLKSYGKGINSWSYASFLQGDFWDPDMLNIPYENVTMDNVDSYVLQVGVKLYNWTTVVHYTANAEKLPEKRPFIIYHEPYPYYPLGVSCMSLSLIHISEPTRPY